MNLLFLSLLLHRRDLLRLRKTQSYSLKHRHLGMSPASPRVACPPRGLRLLHLSPNPSALRLRQRREVVRHLKLPVLFAGKLYMNVSDKSRSLRAPPSLWAR